jgi:3'-phosphoadenosine 5'-phosphosulfate (PAPS) 3'-phosphatase
LSLSYADTVVAAVVQLPFIGTQYTALRGHGAYERTPVVGPRVMRVRGG